MPIITNQTLPNNSVTSEKIQDNTIEQVDLSTSLLSTIQAASASQSLFRWDLNGELSYLGNTRKRFDGSVLYKEQTPTTAILACKTVGTAGTLSVDIRQHAVLNDPIQSILPTFQAPVTSILAPITAISTQSIAAHTTAISTQSITRAKSGLSIQSIVKVQGTNQWKYNLSGSILDADYQIGKSVLVAGASSAGNNGTFTIVETNCDNTPSIVVTNASGVAQTTAAGTLDLQLFSYNFLSAVPSDYVAGDNFLAASHTNAANNGSLPIYRVNSNGNNILVYNTSGVTQASVLGTANTYLFRYNYSAAANTTYFIVGEKAKMASHTNAANNGNFTIRGINVSGNNIVVYNTAGVVQAAAAGNVLPNRFNVNFATNPTAYIAVGDTIKVEGSTTTANNGSFVAKTVASTYVTVYNESGVAQAGASGTFYTTRYVVAVRSTTASLNITTNSIVELAKTSSGTFDDTDYKIGYSVLSVSTNSFIILETNAALADFQSSPAGYLSIESKSIFNAPINIQASTVGLSGDQLQSTVQPTLGNTIAANTWLGAWVMSNFTAGSARDLSVTLY